MNRTLIASIAGLLCLPLAAVAGDYKTQSPTAAAPASAPDRATLEAQQKAEYEANVDRTTDHVTDKLSDTNSSSLTGPSGPTTNGTKIISRKEAERIRGEKPAQAGSNDSGGK